MPLTLITPPSLSLFTLAEAKLHLRVSGSTEDALIQTLIDGAVADAEFLMQRAILPQTWRLTLDEAPSTSGGSQIVRIPKAGVSAITGIQYADPATGTLTAWTDYQADITDLQTRILPAYGKTWPATRQQLAALQITFTAGWASAAVVPGNVKNWVLLRVGALYEHREGWTPGTKPLNPNPHVDRLLDRWTLTTA